MKIYHVLILVLISTAILAGCSSQPFENAYQLKLNAAQTIGRDTGSPTAWNIESTPKIGSLYRMAGNPKEVTYLSYHDGTFEVPAKPYVATKQISDKWSYSVNGDKSIKAQLGYMGLSADGEFSQLTDISFSLDADSYSEIAYDKLVTALNDSDYGRKTREVVLAQTIDLVNHKLDNSHQSLWVVVSITTGKNLGVSFNKSGDSKLSFTTSDISKLTTWLKVPGLVAPSLGGEIKSDTKSALVAPDTATVVTQCYPLVAYIEGPQKGQIYVDESVVLVSANSAKR